MSLLILLLKPLLFILFFTVGYFILSWIRLGYNKLRTPGYGRELSEEEYSKIEDRAEIVWKDVLETDYPSHYSILGSSTGLFFISAAISIGLYWIAFQPLRHKILERIPENADYVFARTDFSFAGILSVPAGLMIATLICIFIANRTPLFKKFLVYQQGWGLLVPSERDPEDICEDILHFHYKKDMDLKDPNFDIDNFLSKILNANNRKIYVITAIFFGLFATFFRFDLYWYEWQDGDQFVKNSYLSTTETSFAFTDITKVDRVCRITKGDKIKAHFEFWVTGPDDVKFDLGHEPWMRAKPIAEFAAKHGSLYASPVEVKKAAAITGEPENMDTCIRHLAHDYNPQMAALLSQIYETDIPINGTTEKMAYLPLKLGLRGPSVVSPNSPY